MKEAEANPATTATRLLDVPPMPQKRAEAKRVRDELDTLVTEQLGKYAWWCLAHLREESGPVEAISIGRI
jgi:hypothetical protein